MNAIMTRPLSFLRFVLRGSETNAASVSTRRAHPGRVVGRLMFAGCAVTATLFAPIAALAQSAPAEANPTPHASPASPLSPSVASSGTQATNAASPNATLASTAPPSTAPSAEAVTLWQSGYASARELLFAGEYDDAVPAFERLARTAPTEADRHLAREMAAVSRVLDARKQARRGTGPSIRSSGELSLLYANAFLYGLGTATWLILQTKPKSVALAMLPFIGFTIASVGAVATLDDAKRFKRGVPQSIVAGTYLGFGEGVWIVGMQQARADRIRNETGSGSPWKAEDISSVLWVTSTGGAVLGGLIGAAREPTPGRVSYTLSTALWGGTLSALTMGAISPDNERRTERAFLLGGIGYNAGIVTGLLTGPSVSPSVQRVRLTDIGGLGGGLLAAGTYLLAAQSAADERAAFGLAAAGAATGLTITWLATAKLDENDAPSAITRIDWRPLVMPVPSGLQFGLGGTM